MDLSRLTQKSQEALSDAQQRAVTFGHQEVDNEHLLVALLEQPDGLVPRLCTKMDVPIDSLVEAVETELRKRPSVSGPGYEAGKIYLSQRLSRLLVDAEKHAKRMQDEYVSVEHLMLALMGESGKSPARDVLQQFDITPDRFLHALQEVRGNQRVQSATPEPTYEALDALRARSRRAARKGKLDPVIGRDEEIRRVIRILSRKTKNNPVLIGEPGVGKTAIVEGLAQRIVRGDVPEGLKDKTIFALDMGALVAGREVPRRVRGAAQGRAQRGQAERGPDHPVHRRAAHDRRRGQGRGRDGRRQHAQADARARRAALHRRDDAGRVPQVHREGRRARAPLPAGAGRAADGRGHDLDPARAARALRGAPRRARSRTTRWSRRRCCRTATSPTASCPTRRSTWSTRRAR